MKALHLFPAPWLEPCPDCGRRDQVYVHDSGVKFWMRLLVCRNRLACRRCKITWRRHEPGYYFELNVKSGKNKMMSKREEAIMKECRRRGYFGVRIESEQVRTEHFDDLKSRIEGRLKKGARKFAVSPSPDVYPYSNLISVIIFLNKRIEEHGGTLIVISPGSEFSDVAWRTKLDQIVPVIATLKELDQCT